MPRRPVTFPHLDPTECVATPSGLSLHCPTLEAVDGHLKRLRRQIRAARKTDAEEALDKHLEDADALLERRLFLQVTA